MNEIERKFLVKKDILDDILLIAKVCKYCYQGYLSLEPSRIVRVRRIGDDSFITIKNEVKGITRDEFEYPIPLEDANWMLEELCIYPLIEKMRCTYIINGDTWELDTFMGLNSGLIIAEIELNSPDQKIKLPKWIGEEVTHKPEYYNHNLVHTPFTKWRI